MGLLDMNAQPQQQMMGGLLGGGMAQGGMQQGGQNEYMMMAQTLLKNPTPETAQMVVMKLKQSGTQGADQLEQVIQQANGDPEVLTEIAKKAIELLS